MKDGGMKRVTQPCWTSAVALAASLWSTPVYAQRERPGRRRSTVVRRQPLLPTPTVAGLNSINHESRRWAGPITAVTTVRF